MASKRTAGVITGADVIAAMQSDERRPSRGTGLMTATATKRSAAAKKAAETRAAKRAAAEAHVAEAAAAPVKVAVVESVERHDLTTAEDVADVLNARTMQQLTNSAIAALTDAGREFMEAVGAQRFDFFDEGINDGSGNWGENMSWQFASMTGRAPKSVSGIMSRLAQTELWILSDSDNEGKWWSLTELGASVARTLAARAKKDVDAAPVVETMSVAQLMSAAESELDAAAQQKAEKRAQKRTQAAQSAYCCDWVDCKSSATTTRVLAGRTWSVCSSHA